MSAWHEPARTSATSRSTRLADARPCVVGRGGPRLDQAAVEHLRGTDHRDTLAPDIGAEGSERFVVVGAGPDDEAIRLRPVDGKCLLEPVGAVVQTVVVGDADRVEARGPQGVERRPAAPETRTACSAECPRSATAVSRFPMATSALRSTSANGPTAVAGAVSRRVRSGPSKFMSPAKAIVIASPLPSAPRRPAHGRRAGGLGRRGAAVGPFVERVVPEPVRADAASSSPPERSTRKATATSATASTATAPRVARRRRSGSIGQDGRPRRYG